MSLRSLLTVVIAFYILFLPLEWAFYTWFHVPSKLIFVIRIVMDVFPILILFFGVITEQVRLTKVTLTLLVVYLVSIIILVISNFIHRGSLTTIPAHFGVLFRFIPITIIVTSLSPKHWNFERLRTWSGYFLFFLTCLGIVEIFLEDRFRSMVLPSESIFMALSNQLPVALRPSEHYDISAFFPSPIEYCFLLIALYIIYLSGNPSVGKKILITILCLFLSFKTGSVAGFLFLLGLIAFTVFQKPYARYMMYGASSFVLALIVYFNWDDILWYLDISYRYSRLGIMFSTFPYFLQSGPINLLFGLGSDPERVYNIIIEYPRPPLMIYYDRNLAGFEDVYWIALLIHNGLISISLLLLILYQFYKMSINLDERDTLLVRRLIWMVIFLGFVNQILEVKSFSLLIWVTFGILINQVRQQRISAN